MKHIGKKADLVFISGVIVLAFDLCWNRNKTFMSTCSLDGNELKLAPIVMGKSGFSEISQVLKVGQWACRSVGSLNKRFCPKRNPMSVFSHKLTSICSVTLNYSILQFILSVYRGFFPSGVSTLVNETCVMASSIRISLPALSISDVSTHIMASCLSSILFHK